MKLLMAAVLAWAGVAAAQTLPSWHEGAAKARIVEFVQAVSDRKSKDYVRAAERVAVFDNDGTLWAEQPLYFQFVFALDQVKAAAPKHPEWNENAAFQALVKQDREALGKMGQKPVLELMVAANTGMTVTEYNKTIRGWLATARHPRFKRPYTDLVYKPMQELLAYLRAHGFKTYIVSGGGIDFMRPWVEKAYGIPPEQVVGSVVEVKFDGAELVREPKLAHLDDGPGKPVGIYRAIGRRPLAAFGNSDGDLQMLQYTMAGAGRRLAVIVRHDDAEREYAYDRQSHIGRLDKALDEAAAKNWVVVRMKTDWKRIFSFESRTLRTAHRQRGQIPPLH
jgi:phosphoglycolate phosphatase-like HAD superfamily hydrolase